MLASKRFKLYQDKIYFGMFDLRDLRTFIQARGLTKYTVFVKTKGQYVKTNLERRVDDE